MGEYVMAADASIYSLIRQPKVQGPMELFGQAMQLKHLVGQGRLQGLQTKQIEDSMARQGQLRDLFSGGGEVTPEQVMAIDHEAGLKFQQNQLDSKKTQAEIDAKRASALSTNLKNLREMLAATNSDGQLKVLRDRTFALFGPEAVADMPQSVNDPNFQQWKISNLMEADQLIERVSMTMSDRARLGESQASNLQQERIAAEKLRDDTGVVVPPRQVTIGQPSVSQPQPGAQPTPQPAPQPAPQQPTLSPKQERERQAKLAAEKPKALQRLKNAQAKSEIVINTVNQALEQAKNFRWFGVDIPASGLRRWVGSFVPGTDAFDLEKTVDTIKANLGFKELQAMREASPTGGALGQVAVEELRMLQATIASLDIGQGQEQLERNLAKIKTHFNNWKQAVQQHYEQTYGALPQQTPATPAGQTSTGKIGGVLTPNPDGSFNYGRAR